MIILAIGTPVAWALATRRFRGKQMLETMIELPLVMPPAVAGIGLLAALGPKGILGRRCLTRSTSSSCSRPRAWSWR